MVNTMRLKESRGKMLYYIHWPSFNAEGVMAKKIEFMKI